MANFCPHASLFPSYFSSSFACSFGTHLDHSPVHFIDKHWLPTSRYSIGYGYAVARVVCHDRMELRCQPTKISHFNKRKLQPSDSGRFAADSRFGDISAVMPPFGRFFTAYKGNIWLQTGRILSSIVVVLMSFGTGANRSFRLEKPWLYKHDARERANSWILIGPVLLA